MDFLQTLSDGGSYFWNVFMFWACWQFCDFVLTKLKVRLKKPWRLDSEDFLRQQWRAKARCRYENGPEAVKVPEQ